jgi:hypothetical protein
VPAPAPARARPLARLLVHGIAHPTCDLPPFADTRTVAEDEASAGAASKHELVALTRVLHALQLKRGQLASVDDVALVKRVPKRVCGLGERDGRKAARLGNLARMRHTKAE